MHLTVSWNSTLPPADLNKPPSQGCHAACNLSRSGISGGRPHFPVGPPMEDLSVQHQQVCFFYREGHWDLWFCALRGKTCLSQCFPQAHSFPWKSEAAVLSRPQFLVIDSGIHLHNRWQAEHLSASSLWASLTRQLLLTASICLGLPRPSNSVCLYWPLARCGSHWKMVF